MADLKSPHSFEERKLGILDKRTRYNNCIGQRGLIGRMENLTIGSGAESVCDIVGDHFDVGGGNSR